MSGVGRRRPQPRRAGSGRLLRNRRIVDDGDGRFGPGGGGGREAEGKFDVVTKGQHVRTGWAGAQPSGAFNEKTRADAPGHGVASGCQGAGFFQILSDGTERPGKGPRNGLGDFLQPAGTIDQKGGHRAGGVFGGGGEKEPKIARCQNGVVIHHQKMCQSGKLFEGQMTGSGESAAETKIFSGREDFARQRRVPGGFHGGRIGAVITNHGGDRAGGLAVEGFEKTAQKFGAQAGGHEGDDYWLIGHRSRMAGLR